MKRLIILSIVCLAISAEAQVKLDDIKSYPFPNETSVSSSSQRVVWALNEEGKRNLFVAQGPDFAVRKLTAYDEDTGQELSSVILSPDGNWVVYIRGGDFGSNWNDAGIVNPTFDPEPEPVQIWSISFKGGSPIPLGEGEGPVISNDSKTVAFTRAGQIWTVPIDGSSKASKLFSSRGTNYSPKWSSEGHLAFVSSRGGHSFIGVYSGKDQPIHWVSPSFKRDASPVWSPDGKKLAFVRRPGAGGIADSILVDRHNPWKIMVADLSGDKAKQVYEAPKTIWGSLPTTHGRTNLHWGNGRIVYLSYEDGWPHLYSIPEEGGNPLLLTPGNFMAEYISMSPDGRHMVFSANTGPDKLDIDRRHIVRVPVDKAEMQVLTPGEGLEWFPHELGGGKLFFVGATAQQPPVPAIMNLDNKKIQWLGKDRIPKDFPGNKLVTPTQVVFKSQDGTPVHASMFQKQGGDSRKPAIIYIHGGPPRQMLLGWHYSSYYSNAYAMNQHLASLGFVVLSVNYRLGIGYGYDFHRPVDGGTRGASEYQDIKAAGLWLAQQDFVDPDRIGVYGGSYGGYLTAMALGRDSELFACGVDIHGVHDRTEGRVDNYLIPSSYDAAPDREKALRVAWESSPVSSVDTWKSPVLIIHGDDDRNVQFSQSTDLVRRLEQKGVELETLVIVDDTHHFMTHRNQMKVNEAVSEYFVRKLKK